MAGLYDDLPEPSQATAVTTDSSHQGSSAGTGATLLEGLARPLAVGPSLLLKLDDASFFYIFSFLALPDVGRRIPVVCPFLRWLRDAWQPWRQFKLPLTRRQYIQVVRLLQACSRSLPELSSLSAAIEDAASRRFLAARHGGVGPIIHRYGELPTPRVLWSLHSEGWSEWRDSCSLLLDADFALLPPWARLGSMKVSFRLGICLYLPPENVSAELSFPALNLCVAIEHVDYLRALAEQHPLDPPCLGAICDALAIRPNADGSATVLEEWSMRFCFGPSDFRHAGHGECDGYDAEVRVEGKRRWRPADLCYTPAWSCEPVFSGIRLLFRGRRCEGLLD